MAALARFYNQSFDRRPYATLAVSNSALNVLGDLIAQSAQMAARPVHAMHHSIDGADTHSAQTAPEDLPVSYDPVRSARFAMFGFAMGAPYLCHRPCGSRSYPARSSFPRTLDEVPRDSVPDVFCKQ